MPAPSYTTWANLTLSPSAVSSFVGSLAPFTLAANPLLSNEDVANAIEAGKRVLYRELFKKVSDSFPETMQQVLDMARTNAFAWMSRSSNQQNMSEMLRWGTSWFNSSFNASGYWQWCGTLNSLPNVWIFDAVPDTTTYANQALNGDFLVNTVTQYVYLNYSIDPTVTSWQRFKPEDLLNYITNPTVLDDAWTGLTVISLCENALASQAGQGAQVDKYQRLLDIWYEKVYGTRTQNTRMRDGLVEKCCSLVVFDVGDSGELPPYNSIIMQDGFGFA